MGVHVPACGRESPPRSPKRADRVHVASWRTKRLAGNGVRSYIPDPSPSRPRGVDSAIKVSGMAEVIEPVKVMKSIETAEIAKGIKPAKAIESAKGIKPPKRRKAEVKRRPAVKRPWITVITPSTISI